MNIGFISIYNVFTSDLFCIYCISALKNDFYFVSLANFFFVYINAYNNVKMSVYYFYQQRLVVSTSVYLRCVRNLKIS